MTAIISVNNLSKCYKINHESIAYYALRDKLAHPIKAWQEAKRAREEFWALSGLNFSVEPGEVLGVIGPNGSGKSTLLKILSRITPPTAGEARIQGRISSLLEVGTGFHPELTGRENVFLSGIILGMTRSEIKKHFDEIIAFAGVEKFLDTPVKRFSSGMMVRLGFAVAAHLESDILIVDEVLAVGDAEFQNKCITKMEEIVRCQNRTILFVSHNESAVRHLCSKAIVLKSGMIVFDGSIEQAFNRYKGIV